VFKQFRDKVVLSGMALLLAGAALLIFTFVSAYGFLTQSLSIMTSQDLLHTLGEALAPLIATCIRIMYLGVMGWIGSLLTIRGITIITHLPQTPVATAQKPETKQQQQPQEEEAKKLPEKPAEPEVKASEPEFTVIPPEEASKATLPQSPLLKDESKSTS
jgi:hypothetical protein